jgi:hypothetical protein
VNSCNVCGKKEVLPYRCKYCGGTFCADHRLPEQHDCTFDGDYWNVPVKVKREIKKPRVSIPVKINAEFPQPARGIAAYGYNNLILAACTILFFISIITGYTIINFLALNPSGVIYMPWQLITSVFLHVNFGHWFWNMIVLFFFGSELERRVGGRVFLTIFILAGLVGNLAYLAYAYLTNQYIPALGASGAIYGVLGTLAVIAPEIRVLFFFLIPMNIRTLILIFAAVDVLLIPYSMIDRVARVAHLGGLFVGLYYGKKLRIVRRWRMW